MTASLSSRAGVIPVLERYEGEMMKVKAYEVFQCDAGWRIFSFLKLTTDDGVVGWSEYNESFGSPR